MYITPTWGMSCMGKPRPSRWTRIASGNLHACGFLCCPWSCAIVCPFPGDIFVRSRIIFGQSRHVQLPRRTRSTIHVRVAAAAAKLAGAVEARGCFAFALACGRQHLLKRGGGAGPTAIPAGMASPAASVTAISALDYDGLSTALTGSEAKFSRRHLRAGPQTAVEDSHTICQLPKGARTEMCLPSRCWQSAEAPS